MLTSCGWCDEEAREIAERPARVTREGDGTGKDIDVREDEQQKSVLALLVTKTGGRAPVDVTGTTVLEVSYAWLDNSRACITTGSHCTKASDLSMFVQCGFQFEFYHKSHVSLNDSFLVSLLGSQ